MFKIALSFVATIALSVIANAKDYSTITKDISEKGSKQTITYDQLEKGSVLAASTINKLVIDEVMYSACGASEEPGAEYEYEATASLVELNKSKYVTYEVSFSYFCGGAHPDAGSYIVVFDAKDGEKLDLDKEVPLQNFSLTSEEDSEKYRMEMAAILVDNMPKELKSFDGEDCFNGADRGSAIEQITYLNPGIHGIGKDLKVVVGISPPYVAQACAFNYEIGFEKVEKYLAPNSKIRKWVTEK